MKDIIAETQKRMDKSHAALVHDLSKLRTGRAHPSLLDAIMVDYYGSKTQLNQMATIHAQDAQTLIVSPWDRSQAQVIEKAIRQSELGLNPHTNTVGAIHVPIPPLSQERRKAMMRVVRQVAEKARIAIRNIRRHGNEEIAQLVDAKLLTEDEQHRAQQEIQKLTDQMIKMIDSLLHDKEKDLMSV